MASLGTRPGSYERLRDKLFASERSPERRGTTSSSSYALVTYTPAARIDDTSTAGPSVLTLSKLGPAAHLHDISSSTIASTALSDSTPADLRLPEERLYGPAAGLAYPVSDSGSAQVLTTAVGDANEAAEEAAQLCRTEFCAPGAWAAVKPPPPPPPAGEQPQGATASGVVGEGQPAMARMRQRLLDAEASLSLAREHSLYVHLVAGLGGSDGDLGLGFGCCVTGAAGPAQSEGAATREVACRQNPGRPQ